MKLLTPIAFTTILNLTIYYNLFLYSPFTSVSWAKDNILLEFTNWNWDEMVNEEKEDNEQKKKKRRTIFEEKRELKNKRKSR